MIDMHNHSLYDVDDGSDSLEETIAMTEEAKRQGVTDIIMTPHYRHGMFPYEKEKMEEHFLIARDHADEIGVNLYLGCEYHVDSDMIPNLGSGRVHTLGDTDYMLLEYSHLTEEQTIRNTVRETLLAGYIPIVVHVERCGAFLRNRDLAGDLGRRERLIQTNADNVLGLEGREGKKFAKELIKAGQVDFIASDAHGVENRASHMEKAYRYVSKKFGQETAELLFERNADRILDAV